MEVVVVLSLLAITITHVFARPNDKGNGVNEDDSEVFKFMLPTVVRDQFSMNISGTLKMSHKNFVVTMPVQGDDENKHCTLKYNYEKNSTLEVYPKFETTQHNYTINKFHEGHVMEEIQFYLYMQAIERENNVKWFEMSFSALGSYTSDIQMCEIENFEKLDHILFKEGVKQIHSILFKF